MNVSEQYVILEKYFSSMRLYFPCRAIVLIAICAPPILAYVKLEQRSLPLDNFGPVTAHIVNLTSCKGPKRRNCNGDLKINTADQSSHRFRNTTFSMTFKKPTLLARVRISVKRLNEDGTSISHNFKMVENPCDQFFLGPLVKKYWNIKGPHCLVPKGTYVGSVNCNKYVAELMGFRFFYGAYRGEMILLSHDCNVYCLTANFVLEPKVEKSEKAKSSEQNRTH